MITFATHPVTEIVHGLSFPDYQRREGINQSLLSTFDYDSGGCPEAYRYAVVHGRPDEPTDAQTLGDQADCYILTPEAFVGRFVVCDEDIQDRLYAEALAQKSKAKGFSRALGTYKTWEAEQVALGKSIVSPERLRQLSEMREALLRRPEIMDSGMFDDATRSQVSVFAGFETRAGWLQLKGRPDIAPEGDAVLDYKTCRSAHPRAFARAVVEYGYDRQAGVYLDLLRMNGADKRRFGFVAQETAPPYLAAIHWLPDEWIRHARVRYRKILLDIADAIKTGRWPGYESGVLMPPEWLKPEIEALAA